jgi:hypothetical protein
VRNYQQWIRSYLPAPLSVALDAYVIPQLDDAYAVNFTATAGGGPGPYAYAWQVDRNNGLGYQAVATTGSTYRVTIMTGQSICARVVVTTSTQTGQGIACATPEGGGATARAATERGAEESPARAYPNPTAGDLEVRVPARAAGTAPAGGRQGATPAGPTLIRLYNAQGVLAYSATAPAGQHRVDTRHLPAGVYQLRLTQGPHVTTEQIVVQH